MEDREIIELFFSRSERAIAELDAKYGAAFHGLAFNILGVPEDAEECVSDAYLGVWNAIPPARPERLCAWVSRVVRNAAVSRRRKNSAAKRSSRFDVAFAELEEALAAPGEVSDGLDAAELRAAIESFLDTLSAENRVIFVRRYWYADSVEDIGGRMLMGGRAVSSRLVRMRRALRKYLAERGIQV